MPKVTAIVSKKCWEMSLVQGEEYELIGIEDMESVQPYFRIIDEVGDPPLYPCCYFLEEETLPPADWIRKDLGGNSIDYYPSEFVERIFSKITLTKNRRRSGFTTNTCGRLGGPRREKILDR